MQAVRRGRRDRGAAVETWAQAVAERHGFSDLSHTVEIFGLCRDCSSQIDTAPSGRGDERPRNDQRGAPSTVRRFEGAEAGELAAQAAVFEDLQYVLRCCEHLVTALAPPQPDTAFVEALWTGALVGYVRCFSGRQAVLTEADLKELQLDGDVTEFHDMIKKLRDHYASRHLNPRESFTIGVAQSNDGKPTGVAVVSTPRPLVDDTTVRLLGRVAYALSACSTPASRRRRTTCWARRASSARTTCRGSPSCTCRGDRHHRQVLEVVAACVEVDQLGVQPRGLRVVEVRERRQHGWEVPAVVGDELVRGAGERQPEPGPRRRHGGRARAAG